MFSQEILKIEPLKLAEIEFQSNLIGNFYAVFTTTLLFFHIKCPVFIVNHCFVVHYMDFTPWAKITVTGCYLSRLCLNCFRFSNCKRLK